MGSARTGPQGIMGPAHPREEFTSVSETDQNATRMRRPGHQEVIRSRRSVAEVNRLSSVTNAGDSSWVQELPSSSKKGNWATK
jgi:hypothetical protein